MTLKFYLDEDVDVLLAKLLRARGFSVETTQEADQLGNSDKEQLEYAITQNRILVTHNKVDFENLAVRFLEKDLRHTGIVLATLRSPYELLKRLLKLLNKFTSEDMKNQVYYL